MAIPAGIWRLDGNGDLGDLNITNLDGQGNLDGTAYGQRIIGLWDDGAKRITFTRLIDPADPSTWETFTGFLIEGASPVLAGHFVAFSRAGGQAARFTYGWKATKGLLQPPG
jgi:hypothetical protein